MRWGLEPRTIIKCDNIYLFNTDPTKPRVTNNLRKFYIYILYSRLYQTNVNIAETYILGISQVNINRCCEYKRWKNTILFFKYNNHQPMAPLQTFEAI